MKEKTSVKSISDFISKYSTNYRNMTLFNLNESDSEEVSETTMEDVLKIGGEKQNAMEEKQRLNEEKIKERKEDIKKTDL